MDFFETVKKRRSIRRFTTQDIPKQDVNAMLEAATLAPSATNEQPWHFIVIRDKIVKNNLRDIINAILGAEILSTTDKLRAKRLSKMRIYSTHFANAPIAIAVLARLWTGAGYLTTGESTARDLGIESASMAAAHILLAATALGYGSCFSSAPAEFARTELEAVLDIKPPWFMIGIISLGESLKIPQKICPRKPVEESFTFIG